MYLTNDLAVQGAVGFSGWGMNIGIDGLKTMGPPIDIPVGLLWWGIGAGASAVLYRVGGYSATIVGGSVFGEVGWHFRTFPLEVTASVRPTFLVGDYIGGFHFDSGGAVRWYF